jgi:hypothetical protein
VGFGLTNAEILLACAGTPIGGGLGYTQSIRLADADRIVSSRREFDRELNSGSDVIGVAGDARIDLTGRDLTLSGTTLVSDRGRDGSSGGLLYTTDHGEDSPAWDGGSHGRGLITMRGDSRISGVRIRGPYHDYYDNPAYPGYIPLDSGGPSERRRKRARRYARGIRILSDSAHVENCELYGWPNQAINIGSSSSAPSPTIEGVYGHDCMMVGFGYVVSTIRGHPRISDCYFNATRHSVDGFGHPDCGYTLENSVFGPSTYSHAVDMHCLAENGYDGDLTAGGRVNVRRCTFAFTHNIRDRWAQAIAFRGYPEDRYVTENCWFAHEIEGEEPAENVANTGYQPVPYRQVNVGSGSYTDWDFVGNRYDSQVEEYREGVGAAVDFSDRGLPDDTEWDDLDPALLRDLRRLYDSLTALRQALELGRDGDHEGETHMKHTI